MLTDVCDEAKIGLFFLNSSIPRASTSVVLTKIYRNEILSGYIFLILLLFSVLPRHHHGNAITVLRIILFFFALVVE